MLPTNAKITALVCSGRMRLKVNQGDQISALETPTGALSDMDRAIEMTVSELSNMGVRMLSAETAQSGIALEIRNSSQTARLGMLNNVISDTMSRVIRTMLKWQYPQLDDKTLNEEVHFTLSSDFSPTPLGAEWMRLVTEWYQARIVPREAFIHVAKQNDLLPADYDDETAVEEINQDELVPSLEEQFGTPTSNNLQGSVG